MNKLAIRVLNKARRVVTGRPEPDYDTPVLRLDCQGQAASDLIREKLLAAAPCMISRIGGTELKTVMRRLNHGNSNLLLNSWRYVRGTRGAFWWDDKIREDMRDLSGFFPCTDEMLNRFADRFRSDLAGIDVLGSWLSDEVELVDYFPRAKFVRLIDLQSWFHKDPWSAALKGRTVLVIHPFESSIRAQYEKRAVLFQDPRVLPEFTLKTFKTVQSLGGNASGFKSWFDALDWMCDRVQEIQFDVAIIGAGAYGLSLAAFVKNMGKKAVHLGGATQLLFGIKGKRWESRPDWQRFWNEHWTRPLAEETPASAVVQAVEDGCYW